MRKSVLLVTLLLLALGVSAQYADYGKMSSMVRQITLQGRSEMRHAPARTDREVCAFVRVEGGDAEVLHKVVQHIR